VYVWGLWGVSDAPTRSARMPLDKRPMAEPALAMATRYEARWSGTSCVRALASMKVSTVGRE